MPDDNTAKLIAEIREAFVRPSGLFGHYGMEARADQFDRWLAEHDRVIAEKAWDDAADLVEFQVDLYAKTAERLMGEGEHVDSARYFAYAAARRTAATELRSSNPHRANPEPKEADRG